MTIYSKQIWRWVVRLLIVLSILLCLPFQNHGQLYQNNQFILEEPDKQLHYGAGLIISAVGYQWGLKKWEDKNKAALFALGLGLTAGIAKESFDNWRGYPYYFDDRDVVATALGSITITIPLFILQKPRKRYKH